MPYGDYNGPNKPNKGLENGACNVTRCQIEPATHYNHGSYKWYCVGCSIVIGQDRINKLDWDLRWKPDCGHDQFETREEMDAREKNVVPVTEDDMIFKHFPTEIFAREYKPIRTHRSYNAGAHSGGMFNKKNNRRR